MSLVTSYFAVICRFVLDVCRRLKERKSYLVWAAVGCLGVSALGDLVTEVKFLFSFFVGWYLFQTSSLFLYGILNFISNEGIVHTASLPFVSLVHGVHE